METYWLSIGRNVDGEPMAAGEWRYFQTSVRSAVHNLKAEIVTEVHGESFWNGEPEETYLLLASVPTDRVGALRAILSHLAKEYEQEAIGMVGGFGPTLVKPGSPAITRRDFKRA